VTTRGPLTHLPTEKELHERDAPGGGGAKRGTRSRGPKGKRGREKKGPPLPPPNREKAPQKRGPRGGGGQERHTKQWAQEEKSGTILEAQAWVRLAYNTAGRTRPSQIFL